MCSHGIFCQTDDTAGNEAIMERSVRRRRVRPQQDAEQHIKLKTDKAGLREHFINPYKGKFLHFASRVCVSCTEPINNVELHNVNSKFIFASYAYLNYTRLLHTGGVGLHLTF